MVAARSLDRWTGLLLQVMVDLTDGDGIFNLWHSSMKQAEVFVMLLDNKNCKTINIIMDDDNNNNDNIYFFYSIVCLKFVLPALYRVIIIAGSPHFFLQ